ncbi:MULTISPECIES: ABC transporter permease [unclassified Chelatococcus]|uniref:ABC transporter permease n=1 Tax=unclassified Chelatococcus TaxID=2638111 RepID=UPI001BCE3D3B|nr:MULTISPECIES: ABC transporter permease [unclassified Chelatococcus]CAH1652632.1 ABC transporter permease [Hyphomicrobiales bacterium]MBS7743007.1 ABC transporter permease [Chelatococcus sp. HY11]MBX3541875.1 ABC transporter permease [Chelatococcus sp.]MCO5074234.1 ABC transporter permease [Chelatococcus sp.]CAH1693962.1 ABC transporter permease [Hyphomicrobiales bacterium]
MRNFREFWRLYTRRASAVIGVTMLGFIVILAIIGPILVPGDPWDTVGTAFIWPGQSLATPLGTDPLGRDILRGVLVGARVSLTIGLAAAATALTIGILFGAIAGYFRGWMEDVLMRITDVFQTIPNFLFAFALVAMFGASLVNVILAIGLVTWPPIARLVRAEFLSLREREYVQSCIVLGMSRSAIIFRQILPNALPPIIVMSSIMVAGAILTEAGLSFLGLGDPNLMSWGTMIGIGRPAIRTAWYIAAIPGVLILLTVLALNLVGEGLNDALNPRLKAQQ